MNSQKRQQLLAILAMAAVGFFALDKLVMTPLTRAWQERSAAIRQLRASLAAGNAAVERESITRQRWEEMRRNTLPANASQAEQQLLKAFDQWSQDARVSVSSIKPQWKRGTEENHSMLECRVDASGSLPTLTRFLYEIERSPMALKLDSVEISARDNTGQQIGLALLVTGLRLAPLDPRP